MTYNRLGGSDKTKESGDHTQQSKECGGKTGSYIGHLLASLDNVKAT